MKQEFKTFVFTKREYSETKEFSQMKNIVKDVF